MGLEEPLSIVSSLISTRDFVTCFLSSSSSSSYYYYYYYYYWC
jgi:hypothetical protein